MKKVIVIIILIPFFIFILNKKDVKVFFEKKTVEEFNKEQSLRKKIGVVNPRVLDLKARVQKLTIQLKKNQDQKVDPKVIMKQKTELEDLYKSLIEEQYKNSRMISNAFKRSNDGKNAIEKYKKDLQNNESRVIIENDRIELDRLNIKKIPGVPTTVINKVLRKKMMLYEKKRVLEAENKRVDPSLKKNKIEKNNLEIKKINELLMRDN